MRTPRKPKPPHAIEPAPTSTREGLRAPSKSAASPLSSRSSRKTYSEKLLMTHPQSRGYPNETCCTLPSMKTARPASRREETASASLDGRQGQKSKPDASRGNSIAPMCERAGRSRRHSRRGRCHPSHPLHGFEDDSVKVRVGLRVGGWSVEAWKAFCESRPWIAIAVLVGGPMAGVIAKSYFGV